MKLPRDLLEQEIKFLREERDMFRGAIQKRDALIEECVNTLEDRASPTALSDISRAAMEKLVMKLDECGYVKITGIGANTGKDYQAIWRIVSDLRNDIRDELEQKAKEAEDSINKISSVTL